MLRTTCKRERTPEPHTACVSFVQSTFAQVTARVLCVLYALQPVSVAFGMELDTEQVPVAPHTESVEETAPVAEAEAEYESQNEGVSGVESSGDTLVESEGETASLETGEVSGKDVGEVEEDESLSGDGADDTPVNESEDDIESEEAILPDVTEEGEGAEVTSETEGGDVAGEATSETNEETYDEVSSGDTASSTDAGNTASSTDSNHTPPDVYETDEDSATTTSVETVVDEVRNLQNKYSFGEGDCTLVADGEFYCVEPMARRQSDANPSVYAEKDRQGDRELFYFDGVNVERVTNNSYDDFAPSFDPEHKRIVWQAMIHDRLQIMYYDISTKATRQVTSGRQNSSNPTIKGDTIVWQEWVDTNWEVMMTEIVPEEDFEIESLTDNMVHDMFPQVYDGMVTWQREKGASWEVIVYDLHTEKQHALEKTGDAKFENPRFVLVFDARHENGDVETVGYDLESGDMMELGTRANPQPVVPVTPRDEAPEGIVLGTTGPTVKQESSDGDADEE